MTDTELILGFFFVNITSGVLDVQTKQTNRARHERHHA
jgi:hypothetical protein